MLLLSLALLVPLACAHSYVASIRLSSGVRYNATDPEVSSYPPLPAYFDKIPPGIFRKVAGLFPIDDVDSPDMQCHGYQDLGSAPAPETGGPVKAGDTVGVQWVRLPAIHYGTFITYLARCPGKCQGWMPKTEKVWFKIAEDGQLTTGIPGTWATEMLIDNMNQIFTPPLYNFTIPESLKAGEYLVRHEILNIHQAFIYPGAQFLPNCFQIEVTGDGDQVGPEEKVAFPGAYMKDSPGILWNVWENTGKYTAPGPAVWRG